MMNALFILDQQSNLAPIFSTSVIFVKEKYWKISFVRQKNWKWTQKYHLLVKMVFVEGLESNKRDISYVFLANRNKKLSQWRIKMVQSWIWPKSSFGNIYLSLLHFCKWVHLLLRRLIASFLSHGRVMHKIIEDVANILIRLFSTNNCFMLLSL